VNDSNESGETNEVTEAPKPRRKRGKQRVLQAGSGKRGLGSIFRSSYRDRKTGKRVDAATWSISYSNNGLQCREYGFATKEIGQAMLEKRIEEVRSGAALPMELRRIRLSDLTALILIDYEQSNRRSAKRVREAIAHLHAYFDGGNFLVADLSGNRIGEYVTDRLHSTTRYGRHPANATVNRELAALKRAFHLGAKSDPPLVQKVPPIRMLGEANARSGFFEVAEFNRILAELPEHLHAPLRVGRMTGWRVASEVLTRRVKHLDLTNGWLRLDPGETKNGEGREFPLTPALRAVLGAQRERTKALEKERGAIIPWLFHDDHGKPITSFRTAWLGACKRAAIRKLPHDLRRTAVRNLERAGVPRSAAMKMVGHKTESIYRRYSIVDAKVLEEAAVKLAALQATEIAESRKAATE
jgi:integrase